MNKPDIKIHVLPGGKMPERKTEGAVGFDCYLRAIVSPTEMDPENPRLRKTIFDFTTSGLPEDINTRHFINNKNGEWAYRLEPMKSVLVGIGFVTEIDFPYFYWVAPR
ncbi:MAG: hypothetical protein R3346_04650, partial [Candidatus Spechtbacterales bacterium]|nr:hypothetical protein [Candidatus Spechtbacterales bacterium]